jgi:hypothetical protein
MTIQAPQIHWPTRDNWAAKRQPKYPDGEIRQGLSVFATSAEIDNLVLALQRLQETQAGIARRRVTEAIKALRSGVLPYVPQVPAAQQLLEPIRSRQQDAHKLHREVWSQHRDARPVDDDAWAVELQRRAAIESEFAAAWDERMKKEEEKEAA